MTVQALPINVTRGAAARAAPGVLCCLSIDVEEYFHAEAFASRLPASARGRLPRRAAPFVEQIMRLLTRYECRATFFVLGETVKTLAPLLREIRAAGHEIACHGDGHAHLRRMTPATLREDLRRARERLADAVGEYPRGYRAPTFSVTHATAWALDEIIDAGFSYDSSVFPVRHDRYGVPGAPTTPFYAVAPSGRRVLEFPPLTAGVGRWRLPMGGGGYLRLVPGAVFRACVARAYEAGEPAMLYVHPWELDADQPRLPASWLTQWRHRVGLRQTADRLARLLDRFPTDTAARVLERWQACGTLPRYSVGG